MSMLISHSILLTGIMMSKLFAQVLNLQLWSWEELQWVVVP